jgi:hypothetical protein
VLGAISPIQTQAQRQQALAALGHTSVAGFQRAHAGLEGDGEWGPLTHAAVLAGLRALGARSPVPVPQHEQEWHAMLVRRSSGEPWQDRIQRVADALDATEYAY